MSHFSKIITVSLLFVSQMIFFGAAARTVDCSPGELAGVLGADAAKITSLAVTGSVDAADLNFVSSSMPALVSLDLSGATVAAYNGKAIAANRGDFPAATLPAYVLAGLKVTSLILPAGITEIGDCALMGAAITGIEIPASVKSIGANAFSGCAGLTSLTVPVTVEKIGEGAFSSCSALAKVAYAPAEIPPLAFANCTKLSEFTVLNDITAIGREAFRHCDALVEFPFGSSLKTVGDFAFCNSGLTTVPLAGSKELRSIGSHAFAGCASLMEVSLPDAASTVGAGAFFDDAKIETLNFPSSATKIEPYTFKGLESLSDADAIMANGVDSIGAYALYGMNSVENVTLPARLTYIGDRAFGLWASLGEINASALSEVPQLGSDVWYGVKQDEVVLTASSSMRDDFKNADQWKEFSISQSDNTNIDHISASGARLRVNFDGITATLAADGTEINSVAVYDASGRLLVTRRCNGAESVAVRMADFGPGLCIIRAETGAGTSTVKIIL